MDKKKIIAYLLILNLFATLMIMISKFEIVFRFINVVFNLVLTPIIFATFLYYILKPINSIFRKKKIKKGKAAFLTIVILMFVLVGVGKYFSEYFVHEFLYLRDVILKIVKDKGIMDKVVENLNGSAVDYNYYNLFVSEVQNHIGRVLSNTKEIFSKALQVFANIVLIILIVFYLLMDGNSIEEVILKKVPKKYKEATENTLEQGNRILSSYIIGQSKVALSLSIMVYIGYKLIGVTSAMFLATTTFILAFIPFIGFFISMIIPYIIVLTMGINMVIKLTILLIVVQTLKGRIVVPLIMGNAMNIHPITDIFLVVGAASLFGPIGAFIVVPIYSLIKVIYINFKPLVTDKNRKMEDK